jgi:hypothetical protein
MVKFADDQYSCGQNAGKQLEAVLVEPVGHFAVAALGSAPFAGIETKRHTLPARAELGPLLTSFARQLGACVAVEEAGLLLGFDHST